MTTAPDEFWREVRRTALARSEGDEDFAQDIAVAVFEGLAGFDGRSPFSHWLRSLISRMNNDRLRGKISTRNTVVEFSDQTVPAYSPPLEFIDLGFIRDAKTRKAANLILAGHTMEEAGQQLGLTAEAVRKRLARLRNKGSNSVRFCPSPETNKV